MTADTRTQSVGMARNAGRAVECLAFGAILLVTAASARAQESASPVQIHGFGGWAYAQTDDNSYVFGTKQGTYDNLSMALNVNGTVTDKLTVVGQFELARRPGFDRLDVNLDFAFAEWKFADTLKLRAGRVKHPFGLYGETFSVGTLRPLFTLPLSIYGPERFTANSVDGLGLTGDYGFKGWNLTYDLYAGRISGKFRFNGAGYEENQVQLGLYEAPFGFDEVVGAKVNVQPPIGGLAVGVSTYRGLARGMWGNGPETALVAHAEYVKGPGQIRAEWGTSFGNDMARYDAYYFEGAYTVWKGVQLAARYDNWVGHIKGDLQFYEQFYPHVLKIQDSHDFTLGLNYWFNPAFVVKTSYHWVKGNRFAAQDDYEDLKAFPTTAQIKRDTRMFLIGAQFSF